MRLLEQTRIEKRRVLFLLLILAVWTTFGLFFGMQNYVRDLYSGKAANMSGYILGWLVCGYSWALLTVPVLAFVRRLSLTKLGWPRFVLVHFPAAIVVSFLQLGIYVLIADPIFDRAGRGLWAFYKFVVVAELQSSLLVYLAIVSAVTVYERLFRAGASDRSENARRPDAFDIPPSYLRRIPIKETGRIVLVDTDNIDWIESYGNYVFLHTPEQRFILRETMSALEKKLDPEKFLRIRRSAIVRVDRIKELHPLMNAEFDVVLENGRVLTSTRRYRGNLEPIVKHQ